MASYQQMFYCKNCKKNVPVNDKGQCMTCHSTQIKKSWSVRFRFTELNGEKQKRLTGFSTKKDAEKAYIEFKTNYIPEKFNNKQTYNFSEVLNNYFQVYSLENEESTIYEKKRIFNNFILPTFKNKDISTITKIDLQDWQTKLWNTKNTRTKKPLSWKYLTRIKGFFYNFMEYCKNIYDIPNPFERIKTPKNMTMKKEIRFWELNEFDKFIANIDDVMWKTFWMTFMFTGARFNEVRALFINDISNNIIHINKSLTNKKVKGKQNIPKATKNHKCIVKQIPDVLALQIKEYMNWRTENKITGNYLFGGDKPLSEGTIRRKLKEHTLQSQVKYINPHGFRHSYVSLLIHLGVSTKVIAELIGDTEMQVISTYGHLYSNAKDSAILLLNEKISERNVKNF